jgi:hypothetical protein
MWLAGGIETAHPGYLGSQDTFHVGTLKGVGRIYQQIDTYSKWAVAKLYTTKTPITSPSVGIAGHLRRNTHLNRIDDRVC